MSQLIFLLETTEKDFDYLIDIPKDIHKYLRLTHFTSQAYGGE